LIRATSFVQTRAASTVTSSANGSAVADGYSEGRRSRFSQCSAKQLLSARAIARKDQHGRARGWRLRRSIQCERQFTGMSQSVCTVLGVRLRARQERLKGALCVASLEQRAYQLPHVKVAHASKLPSAGAAAA
jgi:hypothetical protein